MRKYIVLLLGFVLILASCSHTASNSKEIRVGLLLEDTIDDNGWNEKGYQGLLNIQAEMNVDVFFKERMNTFMEVEQAVADFDKEGVHLIFGHGRIFAEFFNELKEAYPNIHFVSFNGEVSGDNVTSIHFKSDAVGFFAGMVAGKMSKSKKIAVIAAFPWQPEVEGFKKGVLYQEPNAEVYIDYVDSWVNTEEALLLFSEMKEKGADVFYPAGDGFHVQLIEGIKKEGLYAIGFVGDQFDLGDKTVLTSTVQHVDHLYKAVAQRYVNGDLDSGNVYYDFAEGAVSLGTFSSIVPKQFQMQLQQDIENYKKSGRLPNEK